MQLLRVPSVVDILFMMIDVLSAENYQYTRSTALPGRVG